MNIDTTIDTEIEIEYPIITDSFIEQEEVTSTKITEKLREIYHDHDRILKAIIRLYKFIFKKMQIANWQKREYDLQKDVIDSNFSIDIDNIVEKSYTELENSKYYDKMIKRKLEILPIFIDYCYVYYVQSYNMNAPFFKFPYTKNKYRILMSTIKANNTKINEAFEKILDSELYVDMLKDSPPFHLRTDMSLSDIDSILCEKIKPICKDILEGLFKITTPMNKITQINNEFKIEEIDSEKQLNEETFSREDNL